MAVMRRLRARQCGWRGEWSQAMGDDQHGAILHEVGQRGLHQGFTFGVERRSGLVENQNGAFFRMARAMASRWRSPPESRKPFSPITVS